MTCNEISFIRFFSFNFVFVSLFIFHCFNEKYFKLIYCSIFFFSKTIFLKPQLINFPTFQHGYPSGKHMFVEYSCNIPLRYPQYIRKKFSMKLREIFRNNVAGILNLGIFPDCSMNILQMLHAFSRWIKKCNGFL